MSENSSTETDSSPNAILIVVKNLETRIAKLEEAGEKSNLKKFTANAGAVALFLGLVLTIASLYDVFVTKPEATRIAALTQFNNAVSLAAQIRQDLVVMQTQVTDPGVQASIQSAAIPRIINEISTARALLPTLRDSDVGISPLLVLYTEASNVNDPRAFEFVTRANTISDAPVSLRSDAKRYQGKYLFVAGKLDQARAAYQESLDLLPKTDAANTLRAWNLMDWTFNEYVYGDCAIVETNLQQLGDTLQRPGIALAQRKQFAVSMLTQLQQYQGQHCAMPQNATLVTLK